MKTLIILILTTFTAFGQDKMKHLIVCPNYTWEDVYNVETGEYISKEYGVITLYVPSKKSAGFSNHHAIAWSSLLNTSVDYTDRPFAFDGAPDSPPEMSLEWLEVVELQEDGTSKDVTPSYLNTLRLAKKFYFSTSPIKVKKPNNYTLTGISK